MKLWVVVDYDRWGHSTNVVRASTKEEAVRFVKPECPLDETKFTLLLMQRVEVTELREGEGILYCDDVSPDT